MKISILKPEDYRRTPWKNGRGVTTEIAISPAGATLEDFDWRISSAAVSEDGTFSSFVGYTRDLAVIEGDGLILKIQDREKPVGLNEVFRFDGGDEVSCRLGGGRVQDLNLIFRKSLEASMEIADNDRVEDLNAKFFYALVALSGSVVLENASLGVRETAFIEVHQDKTASVKITANGGAYAWIAVPARSLSSRIPL